MLRLLDTLTGSYAEIRPAHPRLLRVAAHVQPGAGEHDWAGVRVLLITDLLSRAAELRGLQVLTAVVFPGPVPAQPGFAERAAGPLGIHPPAARATFAGAAASLGGPVDVHIVRPAGSADTSPGGLVTRVGDTHVPIEGSAGVPAADALSGAADPLAIRLALMSFPHHLVADLTGSVLASAAETTRDWRQRVAEWAESPSQPMPGRVSNAVEAAFGDLDTGQALALLRGLVQDASVPAGAKFETFAFADRILCLELARQVGRLRP
ncbi:MAG: hypothetical protein ACRDNF_01925 [Streptosporangiaceae bacterium]